MPHDYHSGTTLHPLPIMKNTLLSLFCLLSLSGCMQQTTPMTTCDPDNMERFLPLMFRNCVVVGEADPYEEEKQRFRGATEIMKRLSADEKTLLAVALVQALDKAVTPLGLHLDSPDFLTEFVIASRTRPEVEAANDAMWSYMLGWQDVLPRALKQLPPELQQKLEHEYMGALLDCCAAYLIARYAEMNEALPPDVRAGARGAVALIAFHADGEKGHRDSGVTEIPGYSLMKADVDKIPPFSAP